MKNLLDFTVQDLSVWLVEKGIRPFRAGQISKWVHIRQAERFEEMTDLSKELRKKLEAHPTSHRRRKDGFRRYNGKISVQA